MGKATSSAHAFEKVSVRENPDGWLGLAKSWKPSIDDLQLPKDPLLLVLEGTEKPGNLGAILRTANAYGVDAVLCNEPGVDLFNPNVIRTSRGLVFRQKSSSRPHKTLSNTSRNTTLLRLQPSARRPSYLVTRLQRTNSLRDG